MKPGLGRIVDCRVYRSSVECKDTCSSVGLRTDKRVEIGMGIKSPCLVIYPHKQCGPHVPPAVGSVSGVPPGLLDRRRAFGSEFREDYPYSV